MVCNFLINKNPFCFKQKKLLIDLPVEIWIKILGLVPLNELKNLWSQEIVLNSKLAYVIGYLLVNGDIHIYKISSRYWSYFEPPSLKAPLGAKEYFNILRFGKRNNLGFIPKSITVIFFLFTRKCYSKLKIFLQFIYSCIDVGSINSEIVLVNGNSKLSQLEFDFVKPFQNFYQLYLFKVYSNTKITGSINITDLVLEVDNQKDIIQYPKQLKYLKISPKSNTHQKDIHVSLNTLPASLVHLKIDQNINVLDSGRVFPKLEYFECLIQHTNNHYHVYEFLIKNSLTLKHIRLEYNSLENYNVSLFRELRVLNLVKCANIPFQDLNGLHKLRRLSLIGCEISSINNMNFPPKLKEIYISPGNRDILQGLVLPNSLKSITIIDVEHAVISRA